MEWKIYYMDRDVLLCEKPSGTLSEGDSPTSVPRLLGEVLREQGEEGTLFPVHRLDRETTGLLLLARNNEAAASLSRAIAEGRWQKEYVAAVCGIPKEEQDTWTDLLFYDRGRGKSFVVDRERKGVKKAVLSYRIMDQNDQRSLVRVKLHTGRTHQIRVQFASRGLPLVGDRRYGAPAEAGREMRLHAAYVRFPHPRTGKTMEFSSSPVWITEVLKKT